jgi:hypothetical protein
MAEADIALIDRSRAPSSTMRLTQVAKALQTQMDRDFSMAWGARARISPAPAGTTPVGVWSISIVDSPDDGPGIHVDAGGAPHGVVRAGRDWTLAVSHLLLEMAANPRGDRFIEGLDATPGASPHRVRYLVEVCDPCELHHYEIDGIRVSDFVTPDFYRAGAARGTAFDFLRRLRRPLDVPRGGCLSWHDPADGRWHQKRPDGAYAISGGPADPRANPRADRDLAFPGGRDRHDIQAIRRAHVSGRGRARPDR